MTLLISVLAAVISTVVWYKNAPEDKFKVSILCFMFWGASVMWLVDGIVEFSKLGAAIFEPDPYTMLNDAFLGLSVVALALTIWVVVLLIKDPQGKVRKSLFKKK